MRNGMNLIIIPGLRMDINNRLISYAAFGNFIVVCGC